MQNKRDMLFKKCFTEERSKGIFVHECITKGVLAIICSNFFSHCKGDQKKTVAISQMYNHVQLQVHWMHLLNTRICRYTCIYMTPTVQTLHYCPAGA